MTSHGLRILELKEMQRANLAKESLTRAQNEEARRHNIASEQEVLRHDKATEALSGASTVIGKGGLIAGITAGGALVKALQNNAKKDPYLKQLNRANRRITVKHAFNKVGETITKAGKSAGKAITKTGQALGKEIKSAGKAITKTGQALSKEIKGLQPIVVFKQQLDMATNRIPTQNSSSKEQKNNVY